MLNLLNNLHTKPNEVSEMTKIGDAHTPNNKINIVTPFPLEDLQTIVNSMNEYKRTRVYPKDFVVLGDGHFGKVFGYKGYALKYVSGGQSSYSGYGDFRKADEILDAYVLRRLQSVPSVPRLYGVIDNTIIIMEKVDGMTMRQYDRQMQDEKKMDNFIHPNFIKDYEEAIRDILMAGFEPKDLHMDNAMIERSTGKPRIIDVGLFEKLSDKQIEKRGNSKEDIFLYDFYYAEDAVRIASKLEKYTIEARFPELLEERRAKLIKNKEISEKYDKVRKERMEKIKEEERKLREERMKNNRGLMTKETSVKFFHEFGINQIINPFEIKFMTPVKKSVNKSKAEQLIAHKKENNFKNGLHNMFKADKIKAIDNKHKHIFGNV